MSIAENLEDIYARIRKVALDCGRDPANIKLVAVSKRFPASAIIEAREGGHHLFGENYIQEAAAKIDEVGGDCTFHFIGHLQSNKAKIAAGIFSMVETVDSVKLAKMLNKELTKLDRSMDILIQVNIGGDDHKSGVSPDDAEELLQQIGGLTHLRVKGLMTMPPFTEDPELARPHFRALRELSERLSAKGLFFDNTRVELSMGMSNDYPVAIEEGATIIRIGTAIFGQRS